MKGLLYIVLFFPSVIFGQITFFNSYGGEGNDYGKSIVTAMDTSYTIVGATESFGNGNTDVYLFNIDSLGALKWSKVYGGTNVDWGMDLKQTRDTGYVLCGYSNSYSWDYDILIIKTDKNGDSTWLKTYGGNDWDFAYSIALTQDTGYIIAGETYSYGAGISDAYAIKLDSLGDTLWTKTFGGSGQDVFYDVIETYDGNLLFAGATTSTDGDKDYWLVKTDNLGNELWQYIAGDSLDEQINSVLELVDSNYFYIADKESIIGTGSEMIFHKVSENGSYLYGNNYDLAMEEKGGYIVQYANDTDIILGGSSNSSGNGGFDIVNLKISQWGFGSLFSVDGTSGDDFVEEADTTADNSVVIVGTTGGSVFGIQSVFVMKTDVTLNAPSTLNDVFDITNIGSPETPSQFSIYPNPASNQLSVKGISNDLQYEIINTLGQIVKRGNTNDKTISIESLETGIYFIKLPTLSFAPIKFTKI